jgi:hypothetical protein
MKLVRHAVVPAAFAFALVACGSDQSKHQDVRAAEAELTSARLDAQREMAELERRQAREQQEAQQEEMSRDDRAELFSDQQAERAELNAERQSEISEATEGVETERAAMTQQRDAFRIEAKERLQKLSAKANEYRLKSTKLAAPQKSEFDKQWRAYTAKRADVDQTLESLSRAPDAEWGTMRDRVETQLQALEDAVGDLDDEL